MICWNHILAISQCNDREIITLSRTLTRTQCNIN